MLNRDRRLLISSKSWQKASAPVNRMLISSVSVRTNEVESNTQALFAAAVLRTLLNKHLNPLPEK